MDEVVNLPELPNYSQEQNILSALELDLGIDLSKSKEILVEKQLKLQRYCKLVANRINIVFGQEQGYLNDVRQEWLKDAAQSAVLLAASDFEEFPQGKYSDALMIRPTPEDQQFKIILFKDTHDDDYPDVSTHYWVVAAEELMHMLALMNLPTTKQKNIKTLQYLMEASAKRYSLEILPPEAKAHVENEDFRLINGWKMLEDEFGEKNLKEFCFKGVYENIDLQKLIDHVFELMNE